MNESNISTQLLYTTVPIWVIKEEGVQSTGTAFFYNHPVEENKNQSIPLLITNKHVIEGGTKIVVEFVTKQNGNPDSNSKIKVELDYRQFHYNAEDDIAAIPIGSIINQLSQSGKNVYFKSIDSSIIPSKEILSKLTAIEDVLFIGYPSGLYDSHNFSPIVRKGITATPIWNNFNNQGKFLIDAGVYPGSSGSPVFIYNQGSYASENGIVVGTRLLFLGILTESIVKNGIDKSPQYFLGLGAVINSTTCMDFINKLVNKLTKGSAHNKS
ncbi:serine protease [Flavobacteriaceae bacterium]|nr:serine protease [Flavobacteriaceae bacterium]